MNILIIDGQLSGQLVKSSKANFQAIKVMAVGTNATATTLARGEFARQTLCSFRKEL